MKEVKNKNSVQDAYNRILDNIIHLDLKPGEVVTENSLAEKFGLGRTPLREALKRLEVEGLIFSVGINFQPLLFQPLTRISQGNNISR